MEYWGKNETPEQKHWNSGTMEGCEKNKQKIIEHWKSKIICSGGYLPNPRPSVFSEEILST